MTTISHTLINNIINTNTSNTHTTLDLVRVPLVSAQTIMESSYMVKARVPCKALWV